MKLFFSTLIKTWDSYELSQKWILSIDFLKNNQNKIDIWIVSVIHKGLLGKVHSLICLIKYFIPWTEVWSDIRAMQWKSISLSFI